MDAHYSSLVTVEHAQALLLPLSLSPWPVPGEGAL